MKKNIIFIIVFGLISLNTIGCQKQEIPIKNNIEKPVQIITVLREAYYEKSEYLGTVNPLKSKKYSFKMPGKIIDIAVEKGQKVYPGDILAIQEAEGYQLSTIDFKNTLDKARSAYNFLKNNFEKVSNLYDQGAISQAEYDNAKLQLDEATSNLGSAEAAYKNSLNTLKDTSIISDMEGYVVDILYKEGEVVNGGYPIIIVSSKEQKIIVGMIIEDIHIIHENMIVEIAVNNEKQTAYISNISPTPNLQTRTYDVEITPDEGNFILGDIAYVSIITNEKEGILIPISCILSKGEDYVFIMKNNQAEKKIIQLGSLYDTKVAVKGLEIGDNLVIQGMKDIEQGDLLKVSE